MPETYLDPQGLSLVARMELVARQVVEGFLTGRHPSPYHGSSVEYADHRPYAPGDEIRSIDWKLWARIDRYFVKLAKEQTNTRCTILLDTSRSMDFGSPQEPTGDDVAVTRAVRPNNKFEYGCYLSACLAYLILRQQDAVGCLPFDERPRAAVPQRTKRTHLESVIRALDASRPANKTDVAEILRTAAETFPRRGLMILISDLLVEREGLFRGLRMLRSRGHDVMVFHVMDDDELDFSFNGPTRFDGLELAGHVSCNPRALRAGYLAALSAYLDEVRRGCVGNRSDYALLRTSEPLDAALVAYLSRRMAVQRK